MTYEEALEYIHSVCWKGSRPGLERITELCRRLGDLHTREKILSIMLVLKDIFGMIIKSFFITILISVSVDNGWLSPIIELYDITDKEFWSLFRCFLFMLPFITIYNALIGKYTVIHKKITIENKLGIAKLQRFRRIK